jgi:hypothetical protein
MGINQRRMLKREFISGPRHELISGFNSPMKLARLVPEDADEPA